MLLIAAVRSDSVKVVEEILKTGVNPNFCPCDSLLIMVVKGYPSYKHDTYHQIKMLKLLLKAGANPNYKGFNSFTSSSPLAAALEEGHLEYAKILLKYGADIGDEERNTALRMASSDDQKILRILNKWAKSPKKIKKFKSLAKEELHLVDQLEFLIKEKKYNELKTTLKQEINLNISNTAKIKLLNSAICNKDLKAAELMLELRINLNALEDTEIKMPLYLAVMFEDFEMTRTLLKAGADPDLIGYCLERSPMYYAISYGNTRIMKLLLENNADPNLSDEVGYTILMQAAYRGVLEVMSLLIAYGAEVNATDYGGRTALIYAIGNKKEAAVKFLLKHNAGINKVDPSNGYYALLCAVENKSFNIVKMLIENKADLSTKKEGCDTALTLAIKQKSNYNIVRLLLENDNLNTLSGKDIGEAIVWSAKEGFSHILSNMLKLERAKDCPENKKYQALMISVREGNVENVRILLENGVTTYIKERGNTAMFYAISNGYAEIVRLLLAYGAGLKNIGKNKMDAIEIAYLNGYGYIAKMITEAAIRSKFLGRYRGRIITLSSFSFKYQYI